MKTYLPGTNEIIHKVKVDLILRPMPTPVHLVQYDNLMPIVLVSLYQDGTPYVLPDNVDATLRVCKGDGKAVSSQTLGKNESGDAVYFAVDVQMAGAAGTAAAVVELSYGDIVAASSPILLKIDRNPVRDDSFDSTSEINLYLQADGDFYVQSTQPSGSTPYWWFDTTDEGNEYEGTLKYVDDTGTINILYPKVKTDKTLTLEDEAADAAAVGKALTDADSSVTEITNELKVQIEAAQSTADKAVSDAATAQSTADQALSDAGNAQATAEEGLVTAQEAQRQAESNSMALTTKVDDAYVDEDGCLWLVADGDEVVGPLGPFAGGGGGSGSGNNAVLTVTNTTGWLATTVAEGGSCLISFTWSSLEDGMATGSGTLTIMVGGVTRSTRSISQGDVTVDVGEYLSTGSNSVRFKVSDVYGNSRTINFSITVVSLSLESSFDSSTPYSGDITFPYTPTGSAEKTVYFYVDGELYGTDTVITSGRQQTFVISGLSAGTHTLRVYFTATINGEEVRSNELYYDIMVISASSSETLISSSFDLTEVEQYTTITIPFYVYVPNSLTADEVILSVNGETVNVLTNVDRTEQTWTYRADTAGELVLTITCGDAYKSFTLTVTESDIDVEAETQDLELYLTSYGRSNSEADPSVWQDTEHGIAAELTGFNFTSDGWQSDEDGITVLRISGDARVSVPLMIFESDFRTTGKTIEVEFATRDVRDYDAEIFSCFSGDRGVRLTAQEARLRSEQSELFTQYKEDEHVRIAFTVEKSTENRLIYIYINGIISGVVQYPTSDDFSQLNPVGISIGSEGCTTDIYCIRVYRNDLTRYQVLDNWIADTQNGALLKERYEHNDVYDAYGQVVISQLPRDLPYLVLVGESLPEYKGNKLTVDGYFTDPSNPSRDFEFGDASIDVQGTSSAGYVRKNYKIKFNETHTMFDNAVPTKTFTLKADVASSEGCNNVELVRLYNEADPYRTPPQQEDSRIRQGIDGFPMVVFHDNGSDVTFIGKYNWNNDKGTEEVYGFEDGDQSWEVLNNTSDRVIWKSDDFDGDDWQNDFEARYPEDNLAVADLAELSKWLVSTDRTAATGSTITSVTYDGVTYTTDTAEYRLAKFKAEFSQYLQQDSTVFYYLFTELFLLVDSRAKNTFPTMFRLDGKWCWFPYDMDTAIGINNEGTLEFDYGLEDTDQTETGADVYNGQQSVLWNNVRDAFGDEIQAMYQNLRSTGELSYDGIETAFEEHQAKWPEAIFNEDSYYKYIQPLEDDGDVTYLPMCQGSKEEQRKWWLYNRFKYMDSKYNAGDAASDIITLRGYAKSDITVIPYADIYAAVKYGSYMVQTRAKRNMAYTLVCPLDNVNDTEIYIYSCSQLADVGDLSGLKVGFADFSNASKLQAIKIGDGDDSYSNANLTELNVGNSPLLRSVDARNCVNLAQNVDLSGCTGIEEVYMEGTAIPAVTLPNGGFLTTLHLPGTVTNLTIRNQSKLTDLQIASTSQITTLWLENVPQLDDRGIFETMTANSRVRLIGVEWIVDSAEEALAACDVLDTMRGLDENGNNTDSAQVSGTIYVDTISGADVYNIQSRYPDLKVVAVNITCNVYYYTWDGSELLYTEVSANGASVPDHDGPERESTAQYNYTFVGWSYSMDAETSDSGALDNVQSDRYLYAAYSREVRTYTVYFYNGSNLLQTVTVAYGEDAIYTGSTPVSPDGSEEDYPFIGWDPEPTNIVEDTYCYAQFGSPISEIDDDWETIIQKISDGTANYSVGKYKLLELGGSYGSINMQIVGKKTDPLADGSGYAQYSWIAMDLLSSTRTMNSSSSTVDYYDNDEVDSWYESSTNTWQTALSYYVDTAKAKWKITCNEDQTLTIGYQVSYSAASRNTLSLTVNGEEIASGVTNTSQATYEVECKAGDVVEVGAEYSLLNASYKYYGTIAFTSTGDFTVVAEVEKATVRGQAHYKYGTGSIGGWENSSMRSYLRNTIWSRIPETVREGIKTVIKTQQAYNDITEEYTQETEDTVWIPDYDEVRSGGIYAEIYPDNDSRIKSRSGYTGAAAWWTRKAGGGYTSFWYYTTNGTGSTSTCTGSYGLCLGFCT